MIGERLNQRYQLVEELGRGGMGIVYRALDPQLGRDVAVKMVVAERTDPVTEERFRREAQMVAQLDHPAIVPVYDFGRHGNALFFVMPVLQGQTLDRLLEEGPLAPELAVDIVCQVAEALDYSAEQGVIHRDIKPENIMVQTASAGGRPRVSVMDFGLAIGLRGSRLTKTGQLPGTLVYLSPEYILTQEADGRSDLYSLGTILYECLAGEPPFVSSHRGALLFRIVHEAPSALQARGVDGELSRLVALCLAKEPEQRPQRCSEVVEALRAWMQRRGRSSSGEGLLHAALRSPDDTALDAVDGAAGESDLEMADPFWGREDEYRLLRRRLPAKGGREGQWVLLGGDIGIGKSRLLKRLTEAAERQGVWVLRGRYARRRRSLPWHALGELLQDALRLWWQETSAPPPVADLVAGLRHHLPMLEEIVALTTSAPEAVSSPYGSEGRDQGAAESVFDLVTLTLRRLVEEKPLLILLEDVHWAPMAERELGSWIQSWLGSTVLLVTTYGPSANPDESKAGPLARLLAAFESGGWAEGQSGCLHGQLGPLPRPAHGRLVTHLLDADSGQAIPVSVSLLDEVYALSEGNPWLTSELVPSLLAAGCFELEGNRWQWRADRLSGWVAPSSLETWLETRRRGLHGDLRRAAHALAVLGERFPRRHTDWVLHEGEAEDIPQRLVELGVCAWTESPDGVGGQQEGLDEEMHFSSPLLRLTLYGELPRRRRRLLHRRIAQGLEGRTDGSTGVVYGQLAQHYSGADMALEAVTYGLLWARRMTAAGRPETVLEPSRIALRSLADGDLEDVGEVQGELRFLLAEALQTLGRSDAALAELQVAVEVLASCGERHGAARAALLAGRITWLRRRPQETRRWLRRGLELAREAKAQQLMRDFWTLGAILTSLEGDDSQAESLWRQVLDLGDLQAEGGPGLPKAGSPAVLGSRSTFLTVAWPNGGRLDDPFLADATGCGEVAAQVFETLIRIGPGGRPEGGLAQHFQLEDGGLRLRLQLRRDALWHDGRAVDADDVRRHLEGLLRRSEAVPGLMQLRGAGAFFGDEADEVEGLRVLAPDELMLLLEAPAPRLPAALSHPHTALVRAASSQHPPLGTGSFRLVQWQEDAPWVLEAWPHHPRRPEIQEITVRYRESAEAVAEGLQNDDLQLALSPRRGSLSWLRRAHPLEQRLEPTYAVWALQVAAGAGTWAQGARRSRLLGLFQRWVSRLDPLGPASRPAHCLLPAGMAGHRRSNVTAVENRLTAGPLEGATPDPLRLRVPRRLAVLLRDELDTLLADAAHFGLPMYVVHPEDDGAPDIWDLQILRCPLYVPDSDTVLTTWRRLAQRSQGVDRSDTSPDALLTRGRQLQDVQTRHQIYAQLDTLLCQQLNLVPLFEEQARCVMSPRLEGWHWGLGWPHLDVSRLRLRA